MSLQYNQVKKRSLSAMVAIPVVITAIYWNAWSYFFLFLLVVVSAMLEFYALVSLGGIKPNRWGGVVGGMTTNILTFLHTNGDIPGNYLYLLCPILTSIGIIELYKQSITPFKNIAYTLLGIIYVSGPFALLHIIAFSQGAYSYEIVIGILFILWANDTGAYLVGSSLGKHKLFKRISPHKSWEGVLGGAALALTVSYVTGRYLSIISLNKWLVIGGLTVVAGTYGDLIESMLKRSLKVKDSGALIPGHGGLLDRFDSFLLAIPCIAAVIKLLY